MSKILKSLFIIVIINCLLSCKSSTDINDNKNPELKEENNELDYELENINDKQKEEKIQIEFIIDNESYIVKIDKGNRINIDLIPFIYENDEFELYYDDKFLKMYDNNVIYENTKLFVKRYNFTTVNFDVEFIRYINTSVKPYSSFLGIYYDKEEIEEIIYRFNNIKCKKIHMEKEEFENLCRDDNRYIVNIIYYEENREKIVINPDGSFYYFNGEYYISKIDLIDVDYFEMLSRK